MDRENHVRRITCSAIPTHLHGELEERFGAPWYETFGATETGADLSVQPADHDASVGTGCIGRPNPHREARVIGEDGGVVPRGQVGELVLRGTAMMDGYLSNREATEEVFQGGWFHTGDLACMDEHGLVYYSGRKKEMIRRSGENISASEVEEAIKLHPSVQFAACIPLPDELRGEEVKAYVILEDDAQESVTPDELADFCAERLAYFKVPRYWEFRGELPLTPSERIAKHVLQEEKSDLRTNSYDISDGLWR